MNKTKFKKFNYLLQIKTNYKKKLTIEEKYKASSMYSSKLNDSFFNNLSFQLKNQISLIETRAN